MTLQSSIRVSKRLQLMTVQLKEALIGLRHWWYVRRCSTETLKKNHKNPPSTFLERKCLTKKSDIEWSVFLISAKICQSSATCCLLPYPQRYFSSFEQNFERGARWWNIKQMWAKAYLHKMALLERLWSLQFGTARSDAGQGCKRAVFVLQ